MIPITLKNKKLLKSSKVRAWMKEVEKAINIHLKEQNVEEKMTEAIALGCPLRCLPDGRIEVEREDVMDTSKEYIKMCEKAVEVQGECKFQECDLFAEWILYQQRYRINRNHEVMTEDGPAGLEYEERFSNTIWLPRQDQLQGMLDEEWLLANFVNFVFGIADNAYDNNMTDYCRQFTSMEQLWLAFVQKEKRGKVWSGKDWVKTWQTPENVIYLLLYFITISIIM